MFCWVFWQCLLCASLEAKDIHGQPEKRVVSNELALEVWSDLKFGMFIHWGIYSTRAAIGTDAKSAGLAEHLQRYNGFHIAAGVCPDFSTVLSASLRSRQMGTTG